MFKWWFDQYINLATEKDRLFARNLGPEISYNLFHQWMIDEFVYWGRRTGLFFSWFKYRT